MHSGNDSTKVNVQQFGHLQVLLSLLIDSLRNQGFVGLRNYFGRFSVLFAEAVFEMLIQPPQKESKSRLKRTLKSTEAWLRRKSNVRDS